LTATKHLTSQEGSFPLDQVSVTATRTEKMKEMYEYNRHYLCVICNSTCVLSNVRKTLLKFSLESESY